MMKYLAVLTALMMALSPVAAIAQVNVVPGFIDPATGRFVSSGGLSTGSGIVQPKADASGILRSTEEYPPQLQNDAFPAVDTSSVASKVIFKVLRPLGLGWSVSPFGARTVTVTRVVAGPPCNTKLYLFGSDDNVTYSPIITPDAWSYLDTDSAKVDTLNLTIPASFQAINSARTFKLPLPETIYPGRYLQIWATRTDSAFASNTVKMGITYEGRWK